MKTEIVVASVVLSIFQVSGQRCHWKNTKVENKLDLRHTERNGTL